MSKRDYRPEAKRKKTPPAMEPVLPTRQCPKCLAWIWLAGYSYHKCHDRAAIAKASA